MEDTIIRPIFDMHIKIALHGLSLTEVSNRKVGSKEQDQTAHMCSLILLYTLCKLSVCLQTAQFKGVYLDFSSLAEFKKYLYH